MLILLLLLMLLLLLLLMMHILLLIRILLLSRWQDATVIQGPLLLQLLVRRCRRWIAQRVLLRCRQGRRRGERSRNGRRRREIRLLRSSAPVHSWSHRTSSIHIRRQDTMHLQMLLLQLLEMRRSRRGREELDPSRLLLLLLHRAGRKRGRRSTVRPRASVRLERLLLLLLLLLRGRWRWRRLMLLRRWMRLTVILSELLSSKVLLLEQEQLLLSRVGRILLLQLLQLMLLMKRMLELLLLLQLQDLGVTESDGLGWSRGCTYAIRLRTRRRRRGERRRGGRLRLREGESTPRAGSLSSS